MEQIIIDNALTLAKQGLICEGFNQFQSSLEFYLKSVIILEEQNNKLKSYQKEILNIYIQGFQTRIQVLQQMEMENIYQEQTLDYYTCFINNSNSFLLKTQINKNKSMESQQLTLNLNTKYDKYQNSIDVLKILLQSQYKCTLFTSKLYIQPVIWLIQIDDNDCELLKIEIFQILSRETLKLIVLQKCFPEIDMMKKLTRFVKIICDLYKSKCKTILIKNKVRKINYQPGLKNAKNYQKNIKIQQSEYKMAVQSCLKNFIDLIPLMKSLQKSNSNKADLNFEMQNQFIFTFINNYVIKILVEDLETKFIYYLSIFNSQIFNQSNNNGLLDLSSDHINSQQSKQSSLSPTKHKQYEKFDDNNNE